MATMTQDHETAAPAALLMLPLDALQPSPLNPRKRFDPVRLEEMAATMGNGVGIIEPLVARAIGEHHTYYELIAGERRWRAARIAGLEVVPVVVKTLTDAAVLELMVIENQEREDLNALEEGEGFKGLVRFGFDVDALGKRIGRSRRYIYDRIKLVNDLVGGAKTLLLEDRITAAHAVLISRLTPAQQVRVTAVKRDNYGQLESPLFDREESLFTPDVDDQEREARKDDPYRGLKARSVRELEAWIDTHCRLDTGDTKNDGEVPELTAELFPATATRIEEAKKVISITHNHHVHPDAKDGNNQRIYSTVSWKRADGELKSKACDKSVTGVIVVGPGRGESFEVCVNKDCDTHWGKERRERERRQKQVASSAAGIGKKSTWEQQQEREAAKRQAEEEKHDLARAAFKAAWPQIEDALAEAVSKAGLTLLADFIAKEVVHRSGAVAAAVKRLGKPITAEAVLKVFALAILLQRGDNPYWAHEHVPPAAKRFKVDVNAIVKKATTVQTSAQKTAKAATTKKAKKRS